MVASNEQEREWYRFGGLAGLAELCNDDGRRGEERACRSDRLRAKRRRLAAHVLEARWQLLCHTAQRAVASLIELCGEPHANTIELAHGGEWLVMPTERLLKRATQYDGAMERIGVPLLVLQVLDEGVEDTGAAPLESVPGRLVEGFGKVRGEGWGRCVYRVC